MKLLNSPQVIRKARRGAVAIQKVKTGFCVFYERLEQELQVNLGIGVDDCASEDEIYNYYKRGVPMNYVIEAIGINMCH